MILTEIKAITRNKINFIVLIILSCALFTAVASSENDELLQCEHDPKYTAQNINQSNWRRNDQIYISPYKLYSHINNKLQNGEVGSYTIIDVRSKNRFKQYHINNSFNLPYDSLKTRSIFKHKKIVLVGTGSDYKRLENLQEVLASYGFDHVVILDGGLNFWKSKIKLKQLHPNDYHLADLTKLINGDISRWKIIDTSDNDKMTKYFPNVINLDAAKITNKPLTLTKSKLSNKKLIENILLVLPSHANSKEIINSWQSHHANVYTINTDKMSIALHQYDSKQKLISYKKRTDEAQLACLL
ncbi:hypothetical protein MNBD_GAMMA01-1485 [hydrothermal vent metagenome]|uniref:Rhodanese domain-containing protein n=1 Tax=hydrothermal vent metagenome TaxID=652676 RepID=A0A3B0VBM4_9ZZZZ